MYKCSRDEFLPFFPLTKERFTDDNLWRLTRGYTLGQCNRDEQRAYQRNEDAKIMRKKNADLTHRLKEAGNAAATEGVLYERAHEYPLRPETFHRRLMYPLPVDSRQISVERSKLDQDLWRPRKNFDFKCFGN